MLRILLADDSKTVFKVISLALESYIIDITHITDGALFHKSLRSERFDILILDYHFLESLKSASHEFDLLQDTPKVLLLSSYQNPNPELLKPLRQHRVLQKPFDAMKLIAIIEDALGYRLRGKETHVRSGAMTRDGQEDSSSANPQMQQMVEKAVFKYCEAHFKAIAREVLTSEIRRLMDDKARQLVDK